MSAHRLAIAAALTLALATTSFGVDAPGVDFRRDVLPILRRCLDCHGPETQEGALRLDTMAAALRGGDSGEPAIVPGRSSASYLMTLVTSDDARRRMPPDGAEALTAAELSVLRRWIDDQPAWEAIRRAEGPESSSHWSLQPLSASPPPVDPGARHPVDAYIRRRLAQQGLTPAGVASRRTLIRRLHLVVLGLPPTPRQVARFQSDDRVDAWPRLVDQVLSSPRYGERWGAHWLDLVRFGETHGFETNRERPHAWRYRDWVIDSLNRDKPYDQFVREQIAGDSLGAPLGTGFLVAGPHDLVKGQDPLFRQVQRQDELADMISATGATFLGLTVGCARCHNHKFDPVTQTDYYALQAVFAGVQHGDRSLPKSSQQRGQLRDTERRIAQLRDRLAPFATHASGLLLDDTATSGEVAEVEHLVHPRGTAPNPPGRRRGRADDPGDRQRWSNISRGASWWANEPGRAVIAYRPRLAGRHRVWISWGCGQTSHCTAAQYVVDADGDLDTTADRRVIATVDQRHFAAGETAPQGASLWSGWQAAGVHRFEPSSAIIVQGGAEGAAVTADALLLERSLDEESPTGPRIREPVCASWNVEHFPPTAVRRIRFTIEATSSSQPCIDELEVFAAGGETNLGDDEQGVVGKGQGNGAGVNLAAASHGARAASSGDFVHPLHKLEHINDGQYGNARSWIASRSSGWVEIELPEVATIDRIEWARDRDGRYTDRVPTRYRIEGAVGQGDDWQLLANSVNRVTSPPPLPDQYRFAGHEPQRAAAGRKWLQELQSQLARRRQGSAPPTAYVGKFETPPPVHRLYRGDPSTPREMVAPNAIASLGRLSLTPESLESERRLRLAEWLSDSGNPLPARVMANRVWQHHFGAGLVATPSDLGANGATPSHPELLDFLARELIASDWSLKRLHRLLLISETWRQDSRPRDAALAADGASRLLWRFPPRRLEAEPIRDSILMVSGVLRDSMGGPGFSAFEISMENVRHYFPKQQYGPEDWRRMVYMTKVRQEKDSVFGVFDCPDGSQATPQRSRSTTPLQALSLLNSGFVMQQAAQFAERLRLEAGQSPEARVEMAYQACYSRGATLEERAAATQFAERYGWASLCRALLNSNEFLFIP